ncbi:A24 family peptidase [Planctomicrobium sp.]|jgi:hypothetical protein|nr:A24 family peptidase [Planctomicrobium sp.]MBT5019839.1 prepilin peptidase [Planctomicrobium sp.]MDB4439373.1 A24 family peptidase [Planctomicrobium sp.]MDB4743374.1 A24 family peptidase [Planctomicrobium sp.]
MFDVQILSPALLITITFFILVGLVVEFQHQKLPNWLTGMGLLMGLALMSYDRFWGGHLWGLFVGVVIGASLWSSGFAGGGLAKLLFAIGLIGGPTLPIAIAVLSLAICGYFWISGDNSDNPESMTIKGSIVSAVGVALAVGCQFFSIQQVFERLACHTCSHRKGYLQFISKGRLA